MFYTVPKVVDSSFVRDLSIQTLQILGHACGFSPEELRRAYDNSSIGALTDYNDHGSCILPLTFLGMR